MASGARLDVEAIPLSAEARERFGDDAALEFALTGGDDYELCLTVPHDCAAELERIAGHWDCAITRIGVPVTTLPSGGSSAGIRGRSTTRRFVISRQEEHERAGTARP